MPALPPVAVFLGIPRSRFLPGLGALPGVTDLLDALLVDGAVLAEGVGGLVRLHDHRPEQVFLIAGDVQVVLQLQDKGV